MKDDINESKIELLNELITLSGEMFSLDWIYRKVFNFEMDIVVGEYVQKFEG